MKQKILIIGGAGLVGSTLTQYAMENYEVHQTYNQTETFHNSLNSIKIDLVKEKPKILDLINNLKADVVINTVAFPSVDLCEERPELADELHVDVTKDIASACSNVNSKLVHFSTDAVFDGKADKKYVETDVPNPVNYYGKTRLEAEKIVLNKSKSNVILRTAVIYGWHTRSRFTNWILSTLKENKMVDPHMDQYNTPTLVDDIAKSILKIIEKNCSGLFHATGKTCVSRYEFAQILAKAFGYDESLIKPVTSIEKKQQAPRPPKTCLNSEKLEKTIDFDFMNLDEGAAFIYKKSKDSKIE